MASKKVEIQVKMKDEDIPGSFCTLASAGHSHDYFTLDFLGGSGPVRFLTSKQILSPPHFKDFARVVNEQLEKYEKDFGTIPPPKVLKQPEAVTTVDPSVVGYQ